MSQFRLFCRGGAYLRGYLFGFLVLFLTLWGCGARGFLIGCWSVFVWGDFKKNGFPMVFVRIPNRRIRNMPFYMVKVMICMACFVGRRPLWCWCFYSRFVSCRVVPNRFAFHVCWVPKRPILRRTLYAQNFNTCSQFDKMLWIS